MVVGCEDRLASDAVVQVLGHRPCDGHSIVGRGAAPDFVEENEAPRARSVQDGAGFAISTMKVDCPAQVVARADAREHPVHDSDHCPSAGTNEPICASKTHRPIWRSATTPSTFG